MTKLFVATPRSTLPQELGAGVVLTGCQTGTLPHELARKSMELLAREVMPHFRDQGSEVRNQEAANPSSIGGSLL